MNKKFSTLLAAFLVAGGMTSAFAAIGQPTADLKSVEGGKAYQLTTNGNEVLVMTQEDDGTFKASMKAVGDVKDLASSLWTITYSDNKVGGPDFKLVNKLTGCPLSVDFSKLTTTAADVAMGGNVSEWKWLSQISSSENLKAQKFVSYFTTDSVVYLAKGTDCLQAAKEEASKVSGALELVPASAAPYALSAKDLNTKLGTDENGDSFKLSAALSKVIDAKQGDLGENVNSSLKDPFTSTTFRAWNVTNDQKTVGKEKETFFLYGYAAEGQAFANAVKDYVLLQVVDNNKDDEFYNDNFFSVAQKYMTGTATNQKLVEFTKEGTLVAKPNQYGTPLYQAGPKGGATEASYLFQFNYYPTQDSIAISVKGYNDQAEDGKWTTNNTTRTLVTATQLTGMVELSVLETAGPANINFMLGEGTTNRTSVNNNVYVIKNSKGQYLAVPIHNSLLKGQTAAQWVTVKADEQEVMNMPAYQWVVLKNNRQTEEIAAVSPVNVINREFDGTRYDKVQLRSNGGFLFVTGNTFGSDSLVFNAVPEEVVSNEYLGYMNIDEQDLDVMNYNLNYLNPYVSDKFIGLGEGSLLTVKEGKVAFYLTKNEGELYGYKADGTEDIKGLVSQLIRFSYVPYIKSAKGNLNVALDDEHQYYVSEKADAKKFYFKENNFYQPETADAKRPYYALVDLTAAKDITKAGTSDNDMAATLKNQVMAETRTSAFAVLPNDAPLYRRFNSVALDGAVEGNEDAAKLLKFKETYRGNEYLMDEANPTFQNEGVNYLGIWTADKKAAGLSFNVDTAVLNLSTAGKIKPQYFIYVGVDTVAAVPGVPCDATDHKHMDINGKPCDADHCIHAKPAKAGYTVAKYLVSFADSLKAKDADKLYQYGKYTRVGFVKALHMGDSLYFLKNGLQNVAAKDLDLDEVKKYSDVVDLKALSKDDRHHNYTWSFRYVDPEAAANEVEEDRAFLFESNNYDGVQVAPSNAAWLKIQNGCLVLTDDKSTFENAKLGEDNALIFNIEKGSADDMATENEVISTSNVVVAAQNGAVVVKGAEGKSVVVSTILGKVVANQVLASDNVTIAAPAGVVVVTVDGESFKVVVK